jgi:hypothetical protein
VRITPPIQLTAGVQSGILNLSWTGGAAPYLIYRSTNPRFVGTDQADFLPDNGPGGTTFTDTVVPGSGSALFYLVVSGN